MTDTDRQRALWLEHRPLARSLAMSFMKRFPQATADDLFAAAEVGLWDVIRMHPDLPREEFRAVCMVRIRGALLDELRALDWLPRRVRKLYGPHFRRIFFDSLERSSREAIEAEISSSVDLDQALDDADRARRLEVAIDTMPSRDAVIIRRLLAGERQYAVGRSLGISEPRVSQLVGRIMQFLGSALRRHRLKVPPGAGD